MSPKTIVKILQTWVQSSASHPSLSPRTSCMLGFSSDAHQVTCCHHWYFHSHIPDILWTHTTYVGCLHALFLEGIDKSLSQSYAVILLVDACAMHAYVPLTGTIDMRVMSKYGSWQPFKGSEALEEVGCPCSVHHDYKYRHNYKDHVSCARFRGVEREGLNTSRTCQEGSLQLPYPLCPPLPICAI